MVGTREVIAVSIARPPRKNIRGRSDAIRIDLSRWSGVKDGKDFRFRERTSVNGRLVNNSFEITVVGVWMYADA